MNVPRWRSRDDRGQANKPLTRVRTRFAWKFYDRPTCVTIASDTRYRNRVNRKTFVVRNADNPRGRRIFYSNLGPIIRRLFVIEQLIHGCFFSARFSLPIYLVLFFLTRRKKWIKGQLWSISTRNIVLPLMPSIFLLIFSFFLMISKYYHLFYKIRAKSFSRRHRFSLNIWQSLRIKHWSLCDIYPNRNYLSK